MATTTVYNATCPCGEETTVAETHWPATRTDPADGETTPEECPACGRPFHEDGTEWEEIEPEPRERDDFDAYEWDGP